MKKTSELKEEDMVIMKNILLIDDDALVQDLVRHVLVSSGYGIKTAGNGLEGIALFDRGFYDLVITDIYMPGLDGNIVARHIRHSTKRHIPIIAVSGTPWHIEGRLFDDILVKPFTLKTLLNSIECLSCPLNNREASTL